MVKTIKYRQVNFLVKILLTAALGYVIYQQLSGKNLSDEALEVFSTSLFSDSVFWMVTAFLLIPVNLFFEVRKWYLLVNQFEKHTFKAAILDIFSGITGAMITPAAIGDYAARMLRVNPANNWKAVWSNFVNSLSQNIVVVFTGITGIFILFINKVEIDKAVQTISATAGVIMAVSFLLLFFNLKWLNPVISFLANKGKWTKVSISYRLVAGFGRGMLFQILLLSILRYLIFVIQYFFILKFWNVRGDSLMLISAISTIFLIQTVLVLPPLLSWLLRGELALLILGNFSDNGILILAATFTLWLFNQLLPALIGWAILLNTNLSKSLGYESDA